MRVIWTIKKSNQSILRKSTVTFIRRIDAETEALILWSPDAISQLIGKDSDAGKD